MYLHLSVGGRVPVNSVAVSAHLLRVWGSHCSLQGAEAGLQVDW